jgi:hypothetical protein
VETLFDSRDPKGIRITACEGTVTSMKLESFTGAESLGYYSIASFGVSNGRREWLYSKVLIPQQLNITLNAKGCFYVGADKDGDGNSVLCGIADEEGLAIESYGLYESYKLALAAVEEVIIKTNGMFKKLALWMLGISVITFGLLSPLFIAVLVFWGIARLTLGKVRKRAHSMVSEIPKPDALTTLIQSHHERRTQAPALLKPMRQVCKV